MTDCPFCKSAKLRAKQEGDYVSCGGCGRKWAYVPSIDELTTANE